MEKSDTQVLMDAIADVAGAVSALAVHVDERFDALDARVGGLEERVGGLEERIGGIEERIGGIEGRLDGIEERMDGTEERILGLTKEMRSGFESVDRRLSSLEDNVEAINTTLDSLLEGDTLGRDHITLTRPEYDALTSSCNLPNRFMSRA